MTRLDTKRADWLNLGFTLITIITGVALTVAIFVSATHASVATYVR